MAFNTFQWPNEYNMIRQGVGYSDVDQITTLTAQIASLTHQLAIANSMSKGVPIREESSSMIGSYMAIDQTRGEVQYVNSWDYSSYHENNLPIQYYSGWRNHENLHYENPMNAINPPVEFQLPQQEQPSEKKPSLEDILISFIARSDAQLEETEARLKKNEENLEIFKTHMNASSKNFETQMSQIATTLGNINKGVFPSNIERNPMEQCKAITLRSGKELESPIQHEDQQSTPTLLNQDGAEYKEKEEEKEEPKKDDYRPGRITFRDNPPILKTPLPFPQRFQKKKIDEQEDVEQRKEEEEKKEEPTVKEVKAALELKQLPKSLRYALLGNDSFFSVIISSSFAGVEEDEILQVHDKEMEELKLPNESKDCFKIYVVEGNIEALLEKSMKVLEAILVDSFDLDGAELINYAYHLCALKIFYKPIPRFKEPEHRKAKFHLKDRRL